MKHTQKTIAAAVLLDNYYRGNMWLCTQEALNGYELILNGKETLVFADISRRLSDIKVSGFKLEKNHKYNGTKFTAYRLSPTMNYDDIKRLEKYCGFVKPSHNLLDKLLDKLFG